MRCSLTWNGRCALEKWAPPRIDRVQVKAALIGRTITWLFLIEWTEDRSVPAIYCYRLMIKGDTHSTLHTFSCNEKSTCDATFAREEVKGRNWVTHPSSTNAMTRKKVPHWFIIRKRKMQNKRWATETLVIYIACLSHWMNEKNKINRNDRVALNVENFKWAINLYGVLVPFRVRFTRVLEPSVEIL